MNFCVLLLSLFFSTQLLAFTRLASEDTISFPKNEIVDETSYKVSHKLVKTISHLVISTKNTAAIFKRASDFPTQGLVDAHVFKLNAKGKLYAFALWSKGAHGQRVTISELETGKDVFSKNSAWPLDYKLKGNVIELDFLGDMQKSGLPEKKKIILTQKDLVRN